MQQSKLFNRARKYLIVFAGFLFLIEPSSFVYAQSNSKPLSICELLQNKKKYKGKKVLIESFLDVAPETWTFRFEENCPVVEGITVGTDDSFQSSDEFERATSLLSLQKKGEKKLGFSLRWSAFLRLKIRAEGILQTSKKPKYGHLNGYKNIFLITNIEEMGQSQLILIEDWFSKDPKIIVTSDND